VIIKKKCVILKKKHWPPLISVLKYGEFQIQVKKLKSYEVTFTYPDIYDSSPRLWTGNSLKVYGVDPCRRI